MKAVFYTDGSSRPSQTYGGYGVFGYYYQDSKRPKNIRHPLKSKIVFNDKGIGKDKAGEPIEVVSLVEVAYAVHSKTCSNNEAELLAVLGAFRKAYDHEDLEAFTVITDSRYVVDSYSRELKRWTENGWRKKDGKGVSNMHEWTTLDKYRHHLEQKGVKIELVWTKGHSEDYGNHVADMLSVIGSNAARVQLEEPQGEFVCQILDRTCTYAQYKEEWSDKDFILHYQDLFFSSDNSPDQTQCFVSTGKDDKEASKQSGKRGVQATYVLTTGKVPQLITNIREFYRSIPRNYRIACTARLSKFENRDLLRLAGLVPIRYLLLKCRSAPNRFTLIDDSGTFLQEASAEYPFIMMVSQVGSSLRRAAERSQDAFDTEHTHTRDVTPLFIQEGKLIPGNKDKFIDFSGLFDTIGLKQMLCLHVGYDCPSYLALKKIEQQITRVTLTLQRADESNFYTLYTQISTPEREIYTVSVLNKFLARTNRLTL